MKVQRNHFPALDVFGQVIFHDSMFAGVMSINGLFILSFKPANRANVALDLSQILFDSLFIMLHGQMVTSFPRLVLSLGFVTANFAGFSASAGRVPGHLFGDDGSCRTLRRNGHRFRRQHRSHGGR